MLSKICLIGSLLGIVFNLVSSFSYSINYITDVRETFNSTSDTYSMKSVYCELILYTSLSWLIVIILIVVLIISFFYKNICKPDNKETIVTL